MKLHQNSVFPNMSHTNWRLNIFLFFRPVDTLVRNVLGFFSGNNVCEKKIVELQLVNLFLTNFYLVLSEQQIKSVLRVFVKCFYLIAYFKTTHSQSLEFSTFIQI